MLDSAVRSNGGWWSPAFPGSIFPLLRPEEVDRSRISVQEQPHPATVTSCFHSTQSQSQRSEGLQNFHVTFEFALKGSDYKARRGNSVLNCGSVN